MGTGQLKRMRWRCRRGMRELDAILSRYIERLEESPSASKEEAFSKLLDCEDDQLWAWLSGREKCTDSVLSEVIDDICSTH